MVIVILGILAAIAIPKFIDQSSAARTAAIQTLSGSVVRWYWINPAGCRGAIGRLLSVGQCRAVRKLYVLWLWQQPDSQW